MALDDVIKLADAQSRAAQSRADTASKVIDTQIKADNEGTDLVGKAIENEIKFQQAVKAYLQNESLAQNIDWDAQAHDQLERMKILLLKKWRDAQDQAARLSSAAMHARAIISGGGDWDSIRNGWLGWLYLRDHLPAGITIKAFGTPQEPAMYEQPAWLHPQPTASSSNTVPAMPKQRDPGSLMRWASMTTCYPVAGGAAWKYFAGFAQALDEGAAAELIKVQAQIDAADKAALALESQDWDRLKHPAGL
jgi:hypothetical protein